MEREKDELIQPITDQADHCKLRKLAAGVTLAAFGKGPDAVEGKVLHDSGNKAACVCQCQWKASQLDKEVEKCEVCERTCRANNSEFDEAFHFFAVGAG